MTAFNPHARRNLLTGEFVLVSPHRMGRPWNGDETPPDKAHAPSYDPTCYLCPGNQRAAGRHNPRYAGPWAFDNDFPALLKAPEKADEDSVFEIRPVTGRCRVVCYHPDHARTMARMSHAEIAAIIALWTDEYTTLSACEDIACVSIFENRGAMMGASNPHPHGQIWATSIVPNEVAKEDAQQKAWFEAHGGEPLLMSYLARELEAKDRIVLQNDSFVVLTPFWAAWPFETLVLPRRPVRSLKELTPMQHEDLADALKRLTARYDNLFQTPFPYTFGWHQALSDGRNQDHVVLHAHFYPPLLRSASVRKHMVGFEMLAMAQRDLTPEEAAARLRALSDQHYAQG